MATDLDDCKPNQGANRSRRTTRFSSWEHVYYECAATLAAGADLSLVRRDNMKLDTDDYALIGIAMIAAQKVEFALYGIAAHLAHLPEVASDPRFRKLTPSNFLSSSSEKRGLRKATLGQIARKFGKSLLLPESDLEDYVDRRNIIAHDFWREVVSTKESGMIPDHRAFLTRFILDSDQWLSAVRGLLSVFIEAAEKKEGRTLDRKITARLMEYRDTYYSFAEEHLAKHA